MTENEVVEKLVRSELSRIEGRQGIDWLGAVPTEDLLNQVGLSRLNALPDKGKSATSKADYWKAPGVSWQACVLAAEIALRTNATRLWSIPAKSAAKKCLQAGRLDLVEELAKKAGKTPDELLDFDLKPWERGIHLIAALSIRARSSILYNIRKEKEPDEWEGWERSMLFLTDKMEDGPGKTPRIAQSGESVFHRAGLPRNGANDVERMTRFFVEKKGWDVDALDGRGRTALFTAPGESRRKTELLIELGATLGTRDSLGLTPWDLIPDDEEERSTRAWLMGMARSRAERSSLSEVEDRQMASFGRAMERLLSTGELRGRDGVPITKKTAMEMAENLQTSPSKRKI